MLKVDQFRTNSHEVPKSSDCWVSISGSGSSASFLAEPKNWNGTLEPAVGLQSMEKSSEKID
jgi:hypothetical protein